MGADVARKRARNNIICTVCEERDQSEPVTQISHMTDMEFFVGVGLRIFNQERLSIFIHRYFKITSTTHGLYNMRGKELGADKKVEIRAGGFDFVERRVFRPLGC